MTAKKKPATPRTPTRKPTTKGKAQKRRRSAVSGQYGSGEKAAEALARRIVKTVLEGWSHYEGEAALVRMAKAELLAATTVAETAPRYIGKPVYAIQRTENPKDGWWGGTDEISGWPAYTYTSKAEALRDLNRDGLGHARSRVKRLRLIEVG